jgi:hypothetical protein
MKGAHSGEENQSKNENEKETEDIHLFREIRPTEQLTLSAYHFLEHYVSKGRGCNRPKHLALRRIYDRLSLTKRYEKLYRTHTLARGS